MDILKPQILNKEVDIIIEKDNGELPIGIKRNFLLSKVTRKYCAFIDDDDTVSNDYVDRILESIQIGKKGNKFIDCIGICGYIIKNKKRTWQFRHSITVNKWCKDRKNMIYFRTPNHLNPIRSDLAMRCKFPSISFGEDKSYSDMVKPYLKNEIFIEKPIYFYQMGNK
jgi:hypothetical protein